jgi:hypothetical protein
VVVWEGDQMDDLHRHCSIIDFAEVATDQWFDFIN